jgi:uracil-DNA glycosylase
MSKTLEDLRREIIIHEDNKTYLEQGYHPLFSASPGARVVIVGQAPGIQAQTSEKVWSDASGARLMKWLGVSEEIFRDETLIAHLPMDFYYPGKGKTGDLPPRKDFASLWHPQLLEHMPNIQLTLLVGNYAQKFYLRNKNSSTLTETVQNYQDYLPRYLPLVHPSPLNFRWFKRNAWFEKEVVPVLQQRIKEILSDQNHSQV